MEGKNIAPRSSPWHDFEVYFKKKEEDFIVSRKQTALFAVLMVLLSLKSVEVTSGFTRTSCQGSATISLSS